MKRQSKDSEKQTRHASDWFPVPVPSNRAVTCFGGNIPLCLNPQHPPSSLNKVLHFQLSHLSWRSLQAASCCFLVGMCAGRHGCWTRMVLGSSPDSVTAQLCSFGKLLNLSKPLFSDLLDEDDYANCIRRLLR